MFVFTLRTLVILSSHQGYADLKSHQVSEVCHFTEAMCAILSLQWWSWEACPGQTVGAGSVAPKDCSIFLHMLSTAESSAELQGLDVDSLLTEHIPVNKAPRVWHKT